MVVDIWPREVIMDGIPLLLVAAVAAVAAIRSRHEVAVFLSVAGYAAVVVYLVECEMDILPVALVLAVVIAGYGLIRLLPTALSDWLHHHTGHHA
ncbi:MAG: hypothetical protein HYU60_06505 [Magnetospirillum sp.]|nr:hypothetical protein [Magnetospirillum sp.]